MLIENGTKPALKTGQKVIFEGKVYEFGYIGVAGDAIIYEVVGNRASHNSKAVNVNSLKILLNEGNTK